MNTARSAHSFIAIFILLALSGCRLNELMKAKSESLAVKGGECLNLRGEVVSKKLAPGSFVLASVFNMNLWKMVLNSDKQNFGGRGMISFDLWARRKGDTDIKISDDNGFDRFLRLPLYIEDDGCVAEANAKATALMQERAQNKTSCPDSGKFKIIKHDDWSEEFCVLDSPEGRGKRHGKFTAWRAENTKREEGFYNKGFKTGLWTEWFSNGRIRSTVIYTDNGVRTGTLTKYGQNTGNKFFEAHYDSKGRLIKEEYFNE